MKQVLMLAVFAIAWGTRAARADSPVGATDAADPDARTTWEGAVGLRSGFAQVGRWNPMNLGFQATYGLRADRLALLVEGDAGFLVGATWPRGDITTGPNADLGGSLLRGALVARYSFSKHVGAWTKRGERMSHHLYVEAGVGEELVSVSGFDSAARPDLSLGIGYLMWGRLGRSGGHVAGYYVVHASFAPALATPDPFMDCRSCLTETGGHDVGVAFDFGLVFGG
jgi:hypothetical protein